MNPHPKAVLGTEEIMSKDSVEVLPNKIMNKNTVFLKIFPLP